MRQIIHRCGWYKQRKILFYEKESKHIAWVVRKTPWLQNSCTSRTKDNRLVIVWNCAICGKKKSKFIKNQEASGLLNNLGIKIRISKIF